MFITVLLYNILQKLSTDSAIFSFYKKVFRISETISSVVQDDHQMTQKQIGQPQSHAPTEKGGKSADPKPRQSADSPCYHTDEQTYACRKQGK